MTVRIVVTGGSGFIGTSLIDELRRSRPRADIVNLDLRPPLDPQQREHWVRGDATRVEDLIGALGTSAVAQVVHLAARTDLNGRSAQDYSVNGAEGTGAVIEAVQQVRSVERVIFASSRLVCRIGYEPSSDTDYCPPNAYGASKVAGELLIRDTRELPTWIIVRPTSIWGPYFGRPYKDFFMAVARRRYIHPKGIRVRKDFGYVGNAAFQISCLLRAPSSDVDRHTFYICDYESIDVRDFACLVAAQMGVRRPREVSLSVLALVAAIGDVAKRSGVLQEPPLTSFRLANLVTTMSYSTSALAHITGPLPYDLATAIERTVAYMRIAGQLPSRLN